MKLQVALGQIASHVGDFAGNRTRIMRAADLAAHVDLLVLPELCVCGYPPEDLLAYDEFISACAQAARRITRELAARAPAHLHVTLGFPKAEQGRLYNVMQVVRAGKVVATHRKKHLPNYGVFDEKRYFAAGSVGPAKFMLKGQRVALGICHDLWHEQYREQLARLQPHLVAFANASPFYLGAQSEREKLSTKLSVQAGCGVAYANRVGGQDEHVFDGGSHYASGGRIVVRGRFCAEQVVDCGAGRLARLPTRIEQIRQILAAGLRDYVAASGVQSVFVGVSGGIDSAVVLCIAAEAVGSDRICAVIMPSRHTAQMSIDDARQLAVNLAVPSKLIDIQPCVDTVAATLKQALSGRLADTAMENIQSRLRGLLLMGLANHSGGLVATTSNKSELATGYSTLYGDTAGAFDVLKDVSKTRVYELARHFNRDKIIIPQRIITRPPTAELREGQLDSDSLPSYDHVDGMLGQIVEKLRSPKLVSSKYGIEDALTFTKLLTRNEFKRRQVPIGPTLTRRAFGKNWRMPVANYYSFSRSLEDES